MQGIAFKRPPTTSQTTVTLLQIIKKRKIKELQKGYSEIHDTLYIIYVIMFKKVCLIKLEGH